MVLDTVPKRKKKCPSCGKFIFVKSTPDNREKRLMTEDQAADAEAQWQAAYAAEREKSLVFPQAWVNELTGYIVGVERGVIVGVKVSTPGIWPPATMMLSLYADGFGAAAIAEKVGYSVQTVERVLLTRGIDSRVGEQCHRHAGRVFSLPEALQEMPLPCGADCVCHWSPVLRSDVERLASPVPKQVATAPISSKSSGGGAPADPSVFLRLRPS